MELSLSEAMVQSQYPYIGRPNPPPLPVLTTIPPLHQDHKDELMGKAFFPPSASAEDDEAMMDIYGLDNASSTSPKDRNSFIVAPPSPPSCGPMVECTKEVTQAMLNNMLHRHFPHVPSPTFKSTYQAQAVQLAVECKQSFVAVLPTGGGKSLTYTLPCFNPKEDGYRSYVIIPNRALLTDQIERTKAIGLHTTCWTAQNSKVDEGTQVVFLAMESAVSSSFKK